MQKWEYLIVDWAGAHRTFINGTMVEPIEKGNDNLIFNIKSSTYPEWCESPSKILAYLGEQGWELIHVYDEGNPDPTVLSRRNYTFKRPLN